MNLFKKVLPLLLASLLLAAACAALAAGCGSGQPTVISFTSKNNESSQKMKPVLDKMKKKYKGKVIFFNYDMDDPKNKKKVEEYHVSMTPTFIIKNTKGQIKETFMGAAQEEMLMMSIESMIPSSGKPPSTSPGSMPQPGMPLPPSSGPTMTVPMETVPVTPNK